MREVDAIRDRLIEKAKEYEARRALAPSDESEANRKAAEAELAAAIQAHDTWVREMLADEIQHQTREFGLPYKRKPALERADAILKREAQPDRTLVDHAFVGRGDNRLLCFKCGMSEDNQFHQPAPAP